MTNECRGVALSTLVIGSLIIGSLSCSPSPGKDQVTFENADWSRYPKMAAPVAWAEIEREFQNDNIITVSETHRMNVEVHTKDYRYLRSTPPNHGACRNLYDTMTPEQRKEILYAVE